MTDRERARSAARRLAIIRHAKEITGNVSQTCRYYGITRQSYYVWLRALATRDERRIPNEILDAPYAHRHPS